MLEPSNTAGTPDLKIEEMFAFIVRDRDGDEGVMGMQMGGVMLPFVGADLKRIESLVPVADQIACRFNQRYRICKFSNRTDVTDQFRKGT